MQPILEALRNFMRFHKKKAFSLIGFALLFAVLLFPFGDLSDLVTSKVAEATNNQIYLQFGDLGLSVVPQPSLKLSNVHLENMHTPPIDTESLKVAPTIGSLFGLGYGGHVYASGLFKGNLDLKAKEQKEGNQTLYNIDLEAEAVDLASLSKFLGEMLTFPLNLQGRLNIETNMQIDPAFAKQPKGPLQFNAQNFVLPSYNVNTMMGPLQTPSLKFARISVKGKLNEEAKGEGTLRIDEAVLGQEKDELFGKLSGTLDLVFQKMGDQVQPQVGGYDLKVELNVQNSLQSRAGLFFLIFENSKSPIPNGTRYAFRISSPSLQQPPKIEPSK